MINELMIALIIVGSIMVFIVWNTSRNRRKRAEEQKLVEESTTKLKKELEKTASEAIQRMETQAANLENLLEDAERNRTEFEGRLTELKKLIKRGESQSVEIRDLLLKLEDAGEDVEELQQKLEAIEMKISTTLSMPLQVPMQQPMMQQPMVQQPMMQQPMMQQPMMQQPMMQQPMAQQPMMRQVQSPISPPPMLRQSHFQEEEPIYRQPPERSRFEEEPSEARDFEAMLKRSMVDEEEEPAPVRRKQIIDRPSIVLPSNEKTSNVVEGEPVKIDSRRSTSSTIAQRQATAQRTTIAQRQATATAQRQATAQRTAAPAPQRQATAQRAAAPAPQRQATAQQRTAAPAAQRQATAQPQANAPAPSAQANASAVSESNSIKIKNLLLEGKTVEEIARELGLGRGAVELVQEMTRRKFERKKTP